MKRREIRETRITDKARQHPADIGGDDLRGEKQSEVLASRVPSPNDAFQSIGFQVDTMILGAGFNFPRVAKCTNPSRFGLRFAGRSAPQSSLMKNAFTRRSFSIGELGAALCLCVSVVKRRVIKLAFRD